jgi:AmmeMemoRadiSam system protein B
MRPDDLRCLRQPAALTSRLLIKRSKPMVMRFCSLIVSLLSMQFVTALQSAAASAPCPGQCAAARFASLYGDDKPFSDAIAQAKNLAPLATPVSGITVPHHLVAADLIANAFRLIEGHTFDKAILLFPDHFRKSRRSFATTRRGFDTVFGPVETRVVDAERLLQVSDLVEDSDLFEQEHGIGALLPFLKHSFAGLQIVPIAVSIHSSRADWDRFFTTLSGIVRPTTLIIQSTDFSHYLTLGEAIRRDQQTLNVIAAGTLDDIERLSQPSNLDSRGSQYLQARLQNELNHSHGRVIFSSNQQFYSPGSPLAETTSYIVQIHEQGPVDHADRDLPGSRVFCFAGDTFFGRGVATVLRHPEIALRVGDAMRRTLNGCPLIINLEGVMVDSVPGGLPPMKLAMPKGLAMEWLRALNVIGADVANNHTKDLGKEEYLAMVATLREAEIKVIEHGGEADFDSFRLLGLTDLDNSRSQLSGVIADADLRNVMYSPARPPFFAFLHWGTEYDPAPTERTRSIADALRRAAVSLIIGAHPHVASAALSKTVGGRQLTAFSLGNFLFDQPPQRSSGAILEVRVFDQGTFFPRLIKIPNFLDQARHNAGPERPAE